MGNVIVCGFYTEDYRRWLIPLVVSLGQAHDFVLAEKAGHMWETNTMARLTFPSQRIDVTGRFSYSITAVMRSVRIAGCATTRWGCPSELPCCGHPEGDMQSYG
jgi:hypothetical protein